VKFLCDRCKTRYSIGDERVRGKILKIRCKNCANVITVREGMTADPDASPEYAARAKKSTMVAPSALDERGEAANDRGPGPATEPLGAAKQKQGAATEPLGPAKQPLGAAKQNQGAATEPLGPAKQPLGAAKQKQGAATVPLGPAGAAKEPAGAAKQPAGAPKQPGAAMGMAAATSGGQARGGAQPEDPARGQAGAAKRPAAQEFLRGEPVNALGAAFASAMAKPPPALEEEWYVSIDGEQSGPFSLTDAQHWVAHKPFEAELHCWREGFDDWLPVDKVSHFRGLRKRPAPPTPAAPPPMPRTPSVPQRAAAPASVPAELEAEPKPLFAATMASLERGAPPASSAELQPPPARSSARATPGFGTVVPPRTNGAALAPGFAGAAAAPSAAPQGRAADKPGAAKPGTPLGPAYGKMIDDPFELGELGEIGDAETQIEQAPFSDEHAGVLTPAASPPARPSARPSSSDVALTSPHLPASTTLQGTGANPATTAAVISATSDLGLRDDDDGGDLAIGEVSRVVNLADIARPPHSIERPATVRRPGTASGPTRATGMHPRLRSTGAVPNLAGAGFTGAGPADAAPGMMMAPVAKSHRRGLIALIGVAIVVVLFVGGAVVLFVTNDDSPTGGSLGPVHDIDTSRPELPTTHRPNPVGSAGSANPTAPNPFVPHTTHPRPTTGPAGGNHDTELGPPGEALRSDEIEDVARKNQDMTQRCYMRSQRGADSIIVGDVKKIAVTLMIDKDGRVNDVQLSDHAADNLGKCLSGSIRTWKFRQSSGGTFKFSLNFVSG
jgi:predicted Zn finger-like uncharacterized protein